MEQRTSEWFRARMGVPTASNFEKIVTSSGAPSQQAQGYMCRLIGERLLGRSLEEHVTNKWMQHGIATEDEAAQKFEEVSRKKTRRVGFVITPDGRWGCSPDRLIVGENVAVEIKCPSPWKHIEYMLYGPGKDYRPQVQGQMLIGGYDAVCFFSYFPGMPPASIITERDEKFLTLLNDALTIFSRNLDKETNDLKKIWLEYGANYILALEVLSKLMPEE